MNEIWDKVADWVVGACLLAIGGLTTVVYRTFSMLYKHEQQIALMQQAQAQQLKTNGDILRAVGEVKENQALHRGESNARMESLKEDISKDIDRVIKLIRP